MKHLTVLLAAVFFLLSSTVGFSKGNQCVACHAKLTAPQFKMLGHNFADWKKSVHAKNKITCEACHGGDPSATDPVKAHQGILPSKDEKSSVYFQNVPKTCGRCHAGEFAEFQKSVHYKMLQRSGKGPNCQTCHGSMATMVLTYGDLDRTCSLCHGKPTQAAKALSLIRSAKNILDLYQKKHPSEKKQLALFHERYQKIQREWHSFDVDFVTSESEALIKDIKGALK